MTDPNKTTGRTPPHSHDAEQAVLGAMLTSQEAIAEVAEVLEVSRRFYSPAHRKIYDAILALFEKQEPADITTVAVELENTGDLVACGGRAYLSDLASGVATAANAEYYAKIVLEAAVRRELISASTDIIGQAFRQDNDIEDLLDSAGHAIYSLSDTQAKENFVLLSHEYPDLLTAIGERCNQGGALVGLSTGYERLDNLLAGMKGGNLIIIAGRPGMGKSALALNITTNATDPEIEKPISAAFFSLEMNREELACRSLCGEARINSRQAERGLVSEADCKKLALAAAKMNGHKIVVDSSAVLKPIQMRNKLRKLGATHNIGLVVVDYMQLMDSDRRQENRQQDVTQISRALKAIAKDFDIPVIAVSQLSRAVEGRGGDRRPQLSDLRECLAGGTNLYDAITGQKITIREIANGKRAVVYGLNEGRYRIGTASVARAWSTGIKSIYQLRTATGRTIRATGNHPLRTISGWCNLSNISVGKRIAIPRVLPQHVRPVNSYSADELRLLGYLISDGHYGIHRSVGYVKGDYELVDDVCRIAKERFGIHAKDHACPGIAKQVELTVSNCGPGGNPLIEWLREIGVHGELGHEKRVPESVFMCDNKLLGIFVGALWSGDGSVIPRKSKGWCLKFSSTSMGLLEDIQRALMRLGVISVLGKAGRNSKSLHDIAEICIHDADAIIAFSKSVYLCGQKAKKLELAVHWAHGRLRENAHIDRMPIEVTDIIRQAAEAGGFSWSKLGYRCQGKEMGRDMLAKVAARLGRDDLQVLATSDVLWDKVISIEPDGEEEVYDICIPGMNNFVADGIFAHNSGAIEQDADVVMFVYRPEYYMQDLDKDDPKLLAAKGKAEIIIAKQRNGPTGTVYLHFDREYATFSNLAKDYQYQEPYPVTGGDPF